MLYNKEEEELVAHAFEPGLRDPNRGNKGSPEILRDFLGHCRLTGSSVLELGPGHYEFCEALKRAGVAGSALELDPGIAELGRRRGFQVHVHDLKQLSSFNPGRKYDGVFCKGSHDPFWFYGDEPALRTFISGLHTLIAASGWAWIVSCPAKPAGASEEDFRRWLALERRLFLALGFRAWDVPNRYLGAYYSISVPCDGLTVFCYGAVRHRWSPATLLELGGRGFRSLGRRLRRLAGR